MSAPTQQSPATLGAIALGALVVITQMRR
jgi:hypothetical protein